MKKLLTLLLWLAIALPLHAENGVYWGREALTDPNTTRDGTSGTILWVMQAPKGGCYLDKLKIQATGSNVVTVFRVFLNNSGPNTDLANNVLFEEATLASTTASETAEIVAVSLDMDVYLPEGYRVFCTIGTDIAAAIRVSALTKNPTDVQE